MGLSHGLMELKSHLVQVKIVSDASTLSPGALHIDRLLGWRGKVRGPGKMEKGEEKAIGRVLPV